MNPELKPHQSLSRPSIGRFGVIPSTIFKKSLKSYNENNFIHFLTNLFDEKITTTLIENYFIGTSKHWNGATVFWQIDSEGKIRSGKIMLYNSETGKRIKEPYNHINWAHKLLMKQDQTPLCVPAGAQERELVPFQREAGGVSLSFSPSERVDRTQFHLKQCLFGEHLLNQHPHKPVAIVESEKTAIIASAYLPGFIWLACGSLTNLNYEKCKVLQGRIITVFPDLKCLDRWSDKVIELNKQIPGTHFSISDLLEQKASAEEKQNGFDLADYLIRFNYKEFQQPVSFQEPLESLITPIVEKQENLIDEFPPHITSIEENAIVETPSLPRWGSGGWEEEITSLEKFFSSTTLPQSIQLNNYMFIKDTPKFIDSHLATLKKNSGNRIFEPFFNRLNNLKSIVENLTFK